MSWLERQKAESSGAARIGGAEGGAQQSGATYGSYMPPRKGGYGYSVALPLEVGTRVMCRWWDQKMHPVKVMERRKMTSADPKEYEYYVHYTEFNRRIDEWVKLEQLDLDSVDTDVDEKMEDKATSSKMRRHRKRKSDESHVEGHEELDAASLRQHEELTKVKNIAKIELGRYEIETWYFSPFPPEYRDSVKLFFCEFCLNFMKRKEQLQRHMEKHSKGSYNLACIVTFPPYQRKGYGKFLIAFSYELSKKEGKVGTPERPLSDLGMLSYKGYWTTVLLDILKKQKSSISIKELSDLTAMQTDDILNTLQGLDLIHYSKGQHVICADPKVLDRHLKAAGRRGLELDVCKLIWTPYKYQGKNYSLSILQAMRSIVVAPFLCLRLMARRTRFINKIFGIWWKYFLITRTWLNILEAYELSKEEGKVGTPERLLSDLGIQRILDQRVVLDILKNKSNFYMKILGHHLKAAGRGGLEVDACKLI